MSRANLIANAVLWAGAIIASAILDAPIFLTVVVLPSLAFVSLLLGWRAPRAGGRDA